MNNYSEDPITDIRLVKCPISLDDKNQLTFNDEEDQLEYFLSLPHKELIDATYQRRDSVIHYGEVIENLDEYNYVMYKNNNYRNKWFFAFINNMKWANNSMTDIFIETDSFQTWQFNLEYKQSFIEREHVNDDTIGLHTIPENLETGEFITNSNPVNIFEYSSNGTSVAGNDSYVIICATDFPITATPSDYNKIINGVFNGCVYVVATGSSASEVSQKLDELIGYYATAGKLDYIQSIFMVPKTLLYFNNTTQIAYFVSDGKSIPYIKAGTGAYEFITPVTININSTINGYTPKNKKLFTREYNNIILTNNCGTDVVMAYEDFTSNTPKFTCLGSITPGCSIKCIPLNYRLLSDSSSYKSYNYGISGAKFPVCSWTGDTFTNWLTQNGVNVGLQVAGGVLTAAAGVAMAPTTVGASLAVARGVLGVANTLGSVYQHSIVPEQTSGNINSGDITWSSGKSIFTVYPTCIRQEYARIIDNYFSMYGYKINRLKTPNITGRRNWNYIKTIDANIEAYIPQQDLQKIKDMFNNGVTLWHNSATFLDYSQNNDII